MLVDEQAHRPARTHRADHGTEAFGTESVEFVVGPTRDELRNLYRRAAAIVYPQVEEFGMTLVEAAACGAPAIARDAGGACETVVDGVTGTLYPEGGLERAITAFDSARYDSTVISRNTERYGVSRFDDQMRTICAEAVEAHSDRIELREWASELARA